MTKRYGNQRCETGEGNGPDRTDSKVALGIVFDSSDEVARHEFRVKGGGMKKLNMQTSRTTKGREVLSVLAFGPIPKKEVTGRG